QTISADQLSQNRAQSGTIHFLVELLVVVLRTRSESYATTTPDRSTSSTGARAASTFLTPRTLAATRHVGTGLLLLATLTTTSHVGHDSLVYQGLVVVTAKGVLGDLDRLSTIHIQLHLSISP